MEHRQAQTTDEQAAVQAAETVDANIAMDQEFYEDAEFNMEEIDMAHVKRNGS
ncbi:hypothetical protein [Paenibacillus mucilaginosus]|uniref:Uncharacterized protein n=3 Tax=Paenibacillus mucilaginosus TaxID=61624 RepID=H6NB04_9BACL|nr:hypothetical protein [Paenibacillus mucilaginosus]AEI43618.1 hypothetical protein KNP414_05094 [Paenibacillus mucilaginosus KNP414]AFC31259.1 hypothetical protein PM3016_4498 [Paenibacillus mucilaginosus 3016]MCG7216732.1 hypothetical protein [Paenibacillus mucilaginosus]WDM25152.1 hypothetical protein KCX80_22090 [Paenibacillus mucilaginosus]